MPPAISFQGLSKKFSCGIKSALFSRPCRSRYLSGIALGLCAGIPAPTFAQSDASVAPGECAETAPAATQSPSCSAVFTFADLAIYAPNNAHDMLRQVPGFTIHEADDERGLGQASENVLIDGQRVADKSGGATARLRNIPAKDVARIEITDAAVLGIAGLTGQVANVILKQDRASSFSFEWEASFRPQYADESWLGGKLSYSGSSGDLDYTFSLENDAYRGAVGGEDYFIFDGEGTITESRIQSAHSDYDEVDMAARFKYGGDGPVIANLNLRYNPYLQTRYNSQLRMPIAGIDNDWLTRQREPGHEYELSGDFSFPFGPGSLKIIGLRQFRHEPLVITQTTAFGNGDPDIGSRFSRDNRIGETIGRGEYGWSGGSNDWLISFERAFNSLEQNATLENLLQDGTYEDVVLPGGTGKVTEERYEGLATWSRPLGPGLNLQAVGGGEYSMLRHVDRGEPARTFLRPKGSVSLAWRPGQGWDLSLKLERRVGQISFSDFLAQPDLIFDRENDANPDLVPSQSWELTSEAGRNLGVWGKTRLRFYAHRIDDIVDFIPVGDDGVAVGNLPRATRFGVESESTILLDSIGWIGAKLDITLGAERGRVRDPLLGTMRPISNTQDTWGKVNLRHDIPGSNIAWGVEVARYHYQYKYFLTEAQRQWSGPDTSLFIEHKDIAGFNARFDLWNLFDARYRIDRLGYTGRRGLSEIDYHEQLRQHYSRIFVLKVSRTF